MLYEIEQEMNEIWTDAAMRGVAQGVFESSFDGTGESVWGAVELARCALTERFEGVESSRRERVMWQVVGAFEEMVVE